jgi:hypothetical protein
LPKRPEKRKSAQSQVKLLVIWELAGPNRKKNAECAEGVEWRLTYLGTGLHDLALATVPKLRRRDFGTNLKDYLRNWNPSVVLKRELTGRLFRKTYYCRQLLEALPALGEQVKSEDWRSRTKVIRKLLKGLAAAERQFNKYTDRKLPLTDELVRSVTGRIGTLIEDLKEELHLASRLIANEEMVLSGYLKPRVESQFMLDIDNYLARRLPPLSAEKRLSIIAGCAVAAGFFPTGKNEETIEDTIRMRIWRSRQAYLRHAEKEEDELPEIIKLGSP